MTPIILTVLLAINGSPQPTLLHATYYNTYECGPHCQARRRERAWRERERRERWRYERREPRGRYPDVPPPPRY